MKLRTILLITALTAALLGCSTVDNGTGATEAPASDVREGGASNAPASPEEGNVAAVVNDVPGLSVGEWLQPAADIQRGDDHIYVLEFWATWCGPCRMTIPDLNLMHTLFPEQVTLVAITNEDPDRVRPFLAEREGSMDFAVATDDSQRATWNAYMKEYDENGIPHAFLIQNGRVVWHGHSTRLLTQALPQVLGKDTVETRLADRPSADVLGVLQHGENPLSAYTSAPVNLSLVSSLERRYISSEINYDRETGTFTVDSLPIGGYRVDATATTPDGRQYRGSGHVYAGAPLVSVPVQEVMRITSPIDSSDEVAKNTAVRASGFTVWWAPVRTVDRYQWYLYRTSGNRRERVNSGTLRTHALEISSDDLEEGAEHSLSIYGYDASGNYVANLWIRYEDSRSNTLLFVPE